MLTRWLHVYRVKITFTLLLMNCFVSTKTNPMYWLVFHWQSAFVRGIPNPTLRWSQKQIYSKKKSLDSPNFPQNSNSKESFFKSCQSKPNNLVKLTQLIAEDDFVFKFKLRFLFNLNLQLTKSPRHSGFRWLFNSAFRVSSSTERALPASRQGWAFLICAQ